MQLSGKTVLLTGGSAGIGRELARLMKARGASVIVTGRNAERLDFIRAEGFEAIEADLSNAAGVDALIAAPAAPQGPSRPGRPFFHAATG